MSIRNPKEQDLVKPVLQLLALHRVFAWRNNTGALPVGNRFVRFGTPGSGDVLGVLPGSGRFLTLELKHGRNKVTPAEQAFMDAVAAQGGATLEIRSLAELQAALPALLTGKNPPAHRAGESGS